MTRNSIFDAASEPGGAADLFETTKNEYESTEWKPDSEQIRLDAILNLKNYLINIYQVNTNRELHRNLDDWSEDDSNQFNSECKYVLSELQTIMRLSPPEVDLQIVQKNIDLLKIFQVRDDTSSRCAFYVSEKALRLEEKPKVPDMDFKTCDQSYVRTPFAQTALWYFKKRKWLRDDIFKKPVNDIGRLDIEMKTDLLSIQKPQCRILSINELALVQNIVNDAQPRPWVNFFAFPSWYDIKSWCKCPMQKIKNCCSQFLSCVVS